MRSVHAHLALSCAMSSRDPLALCEEVLDGLLALPDLLLLLLERLLVQELAALAGLTAKLVKRNVSHGRSRRWRGWLAEREMRMGRGGGGEVAGTGSGGVSSGCSARYV